jgi:hypothetical protein
MHLRDGVVCSCPIALTGVYTTSPCPRCHYSQHSVVMDRKPSLLGDFRSSLRGLLDEPGSDAGVGIDALAGIAEPDQPARRKSWKQAANNAAARRRSSCHADEALISDASPPAPPLARKSSWKATAEKSASRRSSWQAVDGAAAGGAHEQQQQKPPPPSPPRQNEAPVTRKQSARRVSLLSRPEFSGIKELLAQQQENLDLMVSVRGFFLSPPPPEWPVGPSALLVIIAPLDCRPFFRHENAELPLPSSRRSLRRTSSSTDSCSAHCLAQLPRWQAGGTAGARRQRRRQSGTRARPATAAPVAAWPRRAWVMAIQRRHGARPAHPQALAALWAFT